MILNIASFNRKAREEVAKEAQSLEKAAVDSGSLRVFAVHCVLCGRK